MAMKLYRAREHSDRYEIVVQLDDTKEPKDDNLYTLNWDKAPPAGVTKAAYLTQIRDEVKRLAQPRAAQVSDGTALAIEGMVL